MDMYDKMMHGETGDPRDAIWDRATEQPLEPQGCECEYRVHIDPRTDRGTCYRESQFRVVTVYGTYQICGTCKDEAHMAPYSEVIEL